MRKITYAVATVFNVLLSVLAGWVFWSKANVLFGVIIFLLALGSLQMQLTMAAVDT